MVQRAPLATFHAGNSNNQNNNNKNSVSTMRNRPLQSSIVVVAITVSAVLNLASAENHGKFFTSEIEVTVSGVSRETTIRRESSLWILV